MLSTVIRGPTSNSFSSDSRNSQSQRNFTLCHGLSLQEFYTQLPVTYYTRNHIENPNFKLKKLMIPKIYQSLFHEVLIWWTLRTIQKFFRTSLTNDNAPTTKTLLKSIEIQKSVKLNILIKLYEQLKVLRNQHNRLWFQFMKFNNQPTCSTQPEYSTISPTKTSIFFTSSSNFYCSAKSPKTHFS